MQQLTPGAQIDELRAALLISEQRRQEAEARLADRERQLGILRAELALRDAATSPIMPAEGQLALISERELRNDVAA